MPTNWLDPDERAAWLTLVRIVAKLPATLDAQLMRDAGLSFFEYSVMAMLSEQPDRTLRMSELAAVTNASLSRLSHAAKRLEWQGLLTRETDPHDGRFTRATLTDAGMRTVVQTAPDHVAAVRESVIDALTPAQLHQLRVANVRILARIDPDGAIEPTIPSATPTQS
jgi:DNA-binding MarR family transcriptional regulator